MIRRRFDLWVAVQALVWTVLAALLVWPLASILRSSLVDPDTGALGLANYIEVFSRRRFRIALGNTFIAGIGGMAGALLLGTTLAFLVVRVRLRGRTAIQTLAVLALVSPPFIGAYAWIVLFGANGAVRRGLMSLGVTIPPIYGVAGVILVFSFKFFPNVFLIVSAALAQVNRSLEDAAENLGLSPARRFAQITLPLILPALSASALLAFVLSIADFGTPRLIGRDFDVLATQAFTLYTADLGANPGLASAVSLVLVAISVVLVALQRRLLRRDVFHGNALKPRTPLRPRGWRSVGLHCLAYAIVLIGVMPGIVVLVFSFRRTSGPVFQPGFGLQSYAQVLSAVSDPIWNTLVYSFAAVGGIIVVGTLIGYLITRRPSRATAVLDGLLVVPYVVPGVVMGIGYITAFNTAPLTITGTGLVIVLAIFTRRLPYAARSTATALKQLSPSLEEAAISLGHSPARAFLKVTARLILPGILAGGMMSFVTAMNELSSSLVLYVSGTVTMPVRIYIAVVNGDYGIAAALGSLLLGMTTVAVYAAFRLSGRRGSGFV
jgi:iron(III) transport system permease protein